MLPFYHLRKSASLHSVNYITVGKLCFAALHEDLYQWSPLHWYGYIEYFKIYYSVAAMWLINLVLSTVWLRRFRFGPLEWCWRSPPAHATFHPCRHQCTAAGLRNLSGRLNRPSTQQAFQSSCPDREQLWRSTGRTGDHSFSCHSSRELHCVDHFVADHLRACLHTFGWRFIQ